MSSTAPNIPTIAPGATKNVAVSFVGQLDPDGELLTGSPTLEITKVRGGGTTGHLTNGSLSRNSSAETINGTSVPANQAVIFAVTLSGSGVIGTLYKLKVTCTTDASQTLVGFTQLRVAE
jgi:hypothetical protein